MLLERVADPHVEARHEFVEPRLVIRATTAKKP
jgi:DNA-binding LacI/PurR family transcriptional regulator